VRLHKLKRKLQVQGTVFSGKGEGSKFTNLTWVKTQTEEKLGFIPFPGTLNIRLDNKNASKLWKALNKAEPIELVPVADFCRGRCYRVTLEDKTECALLIPQVADYPKDMVEIVSPVNLREKLKLSDGNMVELTLFV